MITVTVNFQEQRGGVALRISAPFRLAILSSSGIDFVIKGFQNPTAGDSDIWKSSTLEIM